MTLTKAWIVDACACLAKGHRTFPLKFEIEGWPLENVRRPADITSRALLEFPCACEDCLQNLRGAWRTTVPHCRLCRDHLGTLGQCDEPPHRLFGAGNTEMRLCA